MSQTVPEYGGCLWPLDPACAGGDAWNEYSPEQRDFAHALASATLRRLTGGRVGNCPITVRPCKPDGFWNRTHMVPEYRSYSPLNLGGQWINVGCCTSPACSCETACTVDLPRPVQAVTEVKVDGSLVDPADYFVSRNRFIWIGEGDCPFPAGQDLSKPDTELGTFSITYLNSYPVDSVGACAVGVLALEFARSANNSNKCRLPSNVRSIVRQGVSMEMVTGSFPDGMTGLREVDAFIGLWNPRGLVSDSRVWTPDMARY